jgi:hypothetical protein
MSGSSVEQAARREASLRSELKMRLFHTAASTELAVIAAENFAVAEHSRPEMAGLLAAMVYELRTIRATLIGYREQL